MNDSKTTGGLRKIWTGIQPSRWIPSKKRNVCFFSMSSYGWLACVFIQIFGSLVIDHGILGTCSLLTTFKTTFLSISFKYVQVHGKIESGFCMHANSVLFRSDQASFQPRSFMMMIQWRAVSFPVSESFPSCFNLPCKHRELNLSLKRLTRTSEYPTAGSTICS